jgi:hypothetical protein
LRPTRTDGENANLNRVQDREDEKEAKKHRNELVKSMNGALNLEKKDGRSNFAFSMMFSYIGIVNFS